MTNRAMVTAGLFAVTLASTGAFASLYLWNDAKRPPISLADALAKAEQLLGDDAANRYCVSVSLYGDKSGEGKDGAWNLLFAAADGSKKHVYLNMQGESGVKLWNGPIDRKTNEGRRTDLTDVRQRLEALFTKEGIQAQFDSDKDHLVVKYKARDFQVYPRREEGTYSEQLETVSGPSGDGIWLQVQMVNKPDPRDNGYKDGPYWQWMRGTYFTTTPGKFLSIDLRYGPNVNYETARQMWDAFGERTPQGLGD